MDTGKEDSVGTGASAGFSTEVLQTTDDVSKRSSASELRKRCALLLLLLGQLCNAVVPVAASCFLAYSLVQTACRVRDRPWDLAFVVGACTALAMLFWCLRRVERLTPESPDGERRRLQLAVWALSTALSCAFAYRVSLVMPAALVAAIWCMTSSVVLAGFYFLVVCKDRQYRGLDDVDCHAGDGKPTEKTSSADEFV